MDQTGYYDACVKDTCACNAGGDCECFCSAVAAYAAACNEAGACIRWRTPTICREWSKSILYDHVSNFLGSSQSFILYVSLLWSLCPWSSCILTPLSVLLLALFCDYYNPEGECDWHYEPCGKQCMKTCRNPSGVCYNNIPALEGTTWIEVMY